MDGVNRLVASPVSSLVGKVVGILVRDNNNWIDKSDMSAQKFKNIQ